MRRMVCAAALALTVIGQASAQTPTGDRDKLPYMRDPDWLHKPDPYDLYSAWPVNARTGGSARIDCIVTVQGTLRACQVVEEKPAGSGFGAAALGIAPQFVMTPPVEGGKVVEGHIVIPVLFDCNGDCSTVTQGGRKIVQGIAWGQAPAYQDIVSLYPEKARKAGVGGVASLSCQVSKAGGLQGCRVMSEEPDGQGFGSAAIKLSRLFHEPLNARPGFEIKGAETRLTFTFAQSMLAGAPPRIGKPHFVKGPTNQEFLDAFPKAALKENIYEAQVMVQCDVAAAGALQNCRVISETPDGKGFGASVLSLMPKFQLATWTDEGLPVIGGSVRIPLVFRLKDAPPAPADAAAKP